jgi:hypothetical protein
MSWLKTSDDSKTRMIDDMHNPLLPRNTRDSPRRLPDVKRGRLGSKIY